MKYYAGNISTISLKYVLYLFFIISIPSIAGEISITTNSEKAFIYFIEGRDKLEVLEVDSALVYFNLAISEDSTFSLAYLYCAVISNDLDVTRYNLKKAKKYSDNISDGEKILIEVLDAYLKNDSDYLKKKLKQLLSEFSYDKRVHNITGLYLLEIGDDLSANEHFLTSIKLDNTYLFPHFNLIISFIIRGDHEHAEDLLNKVIDIDSCNTAMKLIYGKIQTCLGNREKAKDLFKSIYEKDSSCVEAITYLGHTELLIGEYDKANINYKCWFNKARTNTEKFYARYFEAISNLCKNNFHEARMIFDSIKLSQSKHYIYDLIEYYSHPLIETDNSNHFISNEDVKKIINDALNDYEKKSARLPFFVKTLSYK